MDTADLIALAPLLALATTAVVIMLAIALARSHRAAYGLALVGLLATLFSLVLVQPDTPRQVTPLLLIDGYALYFMALVIVAALVVTLLSFRYWRGGTRDPEEYYVLLLLATLGAATLVASNHFASFFLGLEILSISLYALIAYTYDSRHRVEAGLKYLILAAASAAMLLFGMALLYAATGTLSFDVIASKLAGAGPALVLLGVGLIVAGVGFKLALVPFHLWTPDVYQGAPLPVTAFIATVSKGAMFALILRFFTQFGLGDFPVVINGFALLAILSMLLGNLLAFLQDNLKRMLAYSSIAHMGYLLIPFVAESAAGERAVSFYLAAYIASSLLAFGIMTVLSTSGEEREPVDAYRGLFWDHPWLAVGMAVSLFSLAGIPPSVGLVGKFFLAAAGVESALWWPLIALVVGSVIGVFYYARVGIMLFFRAGNEVEDTWSQVPVDSILSQPLGSKLALGFLAFMVVILGVYPQPLLALIAAIVEGVT